MTHQTITSAPTCSRLATLLKPWFKPWLFALIVLIIFSACIWFFGARLHYHDQYFLREISHRLFLIYGLAIVWLVVVLFWQSKSNKSAAVAANEASEKAPAITLPAKASANAALIAQYAALRKIEQAHHIRDLPGYLVLGAASAGKSSLLKHSGLNFSLARQFSALNEPQQWWLSDTTVFAEINLDDTDTVLNDWQAQLNLLKQFFQRKRWRGLIICYSVHDLQTGNVAEMATLLRDYYQAFFTAFELEVPVYLIVTQCDQLSGFEPCFRSLDEDNQRNYWGMFFPAHLVAKPDKPWLELFDEQFKDLLHRLQARMAHCLQPLPDSESRALAYQLPTQLTQLSASLRIMLEHAFVTDRYSQENPLRGVFFCSAGVNRQNLASTPVNGYFTQKLFATLIQHEQTLARDGLRVRSRSNWWQRVLLALIAVSGLSISVFWINSYRLNAQRLADFHVELNQYVKQANSGFNFNDPLTQLRQAQRLTTLFPASQPLSMGFGLNLHHSLGSAANAFYIAVAEKYLLPGFKQTLEQALERATGVDLYKTLAIYLMLHDVSQRQIPILMRWYTQHAQEILQANGLANQDTDAAILSALLNSYFALAKQPLKINDALVTKARQQLAGLSAPKLAYLNGVYQQVQQPSLIIADKSIINFSRVFQSSDKPEQIPFIYTSKGYKDYMAAYINNSAQTIAGFDWILGTQTYGTSLTSDELKNYIAELYWQDYYAYWFNSIQNVRVIQFNNLDQAQTALAVLTQPDSPLNGLLSLLQQNLANTPIETDNDLSDLSAHASKLKLLIKLLNNNNEQVNYSQLVKALSDLQSQLQQVTSAQDPAQAAFKLAKASFQNEAGNPALNQLFNLAKQTPPPVSQWLQSIGTQIWQLILVQAKNYIEREWHAQIFNDYQQTIAIYYPFNERTDQEVDLVSFTEFFSANGKLAQFNQNYIQPFAETGSNQWKLMTRYGQALPLKPETLAQFDLAKELTAGLFAQGNELGITFIIRPYELDARVLQQQLSFNQNNIIYRHGPEYDAEIRWPGQTLNQQASLTFYLTNGEVLRDSVSGSWALFKLFAQGKLSMDGRRSARLTFQLGQAGSTFILSSEKPAGIKILTLLQQFKLSKDL